AAFSRLSAAVGDRPVIVAASTHEAEEAAIVRALKRKYHWPIDTTSFPSNAADGRASVEAGQAGGLRVDDPGQADEDGPEGDHHARTEFIDEVAFERCEPGLDDDEQREGDLDAGPRPAELTLDFGNEQGPCILDVRGGDHADDADGELEPARIAGGRLLWLKRGCR
ncbi:hypothetical protein LTR94_032433, partial [Friedmanniomyces endolithicus]